MAQDAGLIPNDTQWPCRTLVVELVSSPFVGGGKAVSVVMPAVAKAKGWRVIAGGGGAKRLGRNCSHP